MKTLWIILSLVGFISVADARQEDSGARAKHQSGFKAAPPPPMPASSSTNRVQTKMMQPNNQRFQSRVPSSQPNMKRFQSGAPSSQPDIKRYQRSVSPSQPTLKPFQGNVAPTQRINKRYQTVTPTQPNVDRYQTTRPTVEAPREWSQETRGERRGKQTWRSGGEHHDYHRQYQGRHRGGHGDSNYYYQGGTSVFVPNWYYGNYPYYYDYGNYPYPSSNYYSTPVYSNRLFICYEEDQISDDRYHISCPRSISWYSTDPVYDTQDYRSQYRPEYVCPDAGASNYVEFTNSYDANTWWNNNCDRWIYTSY